jgi:hypothetical protein
MKLKRENLCIRYMDTQVLFVGKKRKTMFTTGIISAQPLASSNYVNGKGFTAHVGKNSTTKLFTNDV